jgi:hypothetical protein
MISYLLVLVLLVVPPLLMPLLLVRLRLLLMDCCRWLLRCCWLLLCCWLLTCSWLPLPPLGALTVSVATRVVFPWPLVVLLKLMLLT